MVTLTFFRRFWFVVLLMFIIFFSRLYLGAAAGGPIAPLRPIVARLRRRSGKVRKGRVAALPRNDAFGPSVAKGRGRGSCSRRAASRKQRCVRFVHGERRSRGRSAKHTRRLRASDLTSSGGCGTVTRRGGRAQGWGRASLLEKLGKKTRGGSRSTAGQYTVIAGLLAGSGFTKGMPGTQGGIWGPCGTF